jgi:hypothetical protein
MDPVAIPLWIGGVLLAIVFFHAMASEEFPTIRWYHIVAMIVIVAITLFAMVLVGS